MTVTLLGNNLCSGLHHSVFHSISLPIQRPPGRRVRNSPEASLLVPLRHTEQGGAEHIIHNSSCGQDVRSPVPLRSTLSEILLHLLVT